MVTTSIGQLALFVYVLVVFVLTAYNRQLIRDLQTTDVDRRHMQVTAFAWPLMMIAFIFVIIPRTLLKVAGTGFRKKL